MAEREGHVVAMWDQDVEDVQGVTAHEIVTAVGKARDAFWAVIGEQFPLVTTGDMAPGEELALEWAMNWTVSVWLRNNHPPFDMAGFRLSMCCGAPLVDQDEMYLVCDTCGQPTDVRREWASRGD